MTQQTPAQARVIDPILTTHALGYVRPGNVGQFLFPRVDVGSYGGQILTFGKEGFRQYNTLRAPGGSTQRVQFGYLGEKYAILSHDLEAVVPDELATDSAAVPGIDRSSDSVDLVLDILDLGHERECAAIARDANKYDNNHKLALVGTSRWTGASGKPSTDISNAREAIRESTGLRGNVVILSPSAFTAAKNSTEVLERYKYSTPDTVTTDMLAKLWEVNAVHVGDAISAAGQNDTLSDVWGDDVIVAYVAPPSGSNRRNAARPSYGYTYSIKGHPNVRKAYRDENRVSWIHPVSNHRTPAMSGMVAGFLLQNAGAPAA